MSKTMETIRVERTSGNYTIIYNEVFKDTKLTSSAKGVLCQILSLDDRTWDFTVKGLVTLFKDGEASIRSSLKELEQRGYLRKERKRDDKGRIIGTLWIISETARFAKEEDETEHFEQLTIDTLPTMTVPEEPESAEEIYEDSPTFTTKNGDYKVTKKLYDTLRKAYPGADIDTELQKAAAWIACNPNKKKTKRGMARFLNTWMSNASARTTYSKKGSKSNGYSRKTERDTDYSNAGEFFR